MVIIGSLRKNEHFSNGIMVDISFNYINIVDDISIYGGGKRLLLMKIAGTYYNLNHKALEIYFSGCKAPHCKGCHNPELWDFNVGYDAFGSINDAIIRKCNNPMVERVWILGGEPLDQDEDRLWLFLAMLKHWTQDKNTEIWLWTRYTEIPTLISKRFTHAKLGAYNPDLPPYVDKDYGIELASSNQRIIKL